MQRYESAMSWRAHDGEVYSVEFSYDENTVFSIGEDGKVCVCYAIWKISSLDTNTMNKDWPPCLEVNEQMFVFVYLVYPVEHP